MTQGITISASGQAVSPVPKLFPEHFSKLARESGLTAETLIANGVRSINDKSEVVVLLGWTGAPKAILPAICFPYNGNGYARIRPDNPRKDPRGGVVKYEAPRGERNRPYFPNGLAAYFEDTRQELCFTEGERKTLKAMQDGFPTIGLSGVYAWCPKGREELLPELAVIKWQGRRVFLVFDSDIIRNDKVLDAECRLAAVLKAKGAIVKVVRLPEGADGSDGKPAKVGLDDFLVAHGAGPFRALLDQAIDPADVDSGEAKPNARSADPAKEADAFLQPHREGEQLKLRCWNGSLFGHRNGRFIEVPPPDMAARIIEHLNSRYYGVTKNVTANVLEQVKALTNLPAYHRPPTFLPGAGDKVRDWNPADVMAFKNGLVHLPSFLAGRADYLQPTTPAFFTLSAVDYPFNAEAQDPNHWLEFLDDNWRNDPASIEALQEWFGLCLTADMSLHKMLVIIGPPRSGKGTIARVLRRLIGEENTANPTLSSMASQFGLAGLLGKMLAIVSDARLGGKADAAVIAERLLSITGEDPQDIERKFQPTLTSVRLSVRFMILSNELPRLADTSGALSSRMIILRQTRSFFGKENYRLIDDLLEERARILKWACEGLRRLRERGHLREPESSLDLHGMMDTIASPHSQFVEDCCDVTDHNASIRCDDLFDAWCWWCDQKNREKGTDAMFGRNLFAAVTNLRRRQKGTAPNKRWLYEGLNVQPGVEALLQGLGVFRSRIEPKPVRQQYQESEF